MELEKFNLGQPFVGQALPYYRAIKVSAKNCEHCKKMLQKAKDGGLEVILVDGEGGKHIVAVVEVV
jgi:hypothetical protein